MIREDPPQENASVRQRSAIADWFTWLPADGAWYRYAEPVSQGNSAAVMSTRYLAEVKLRRNNANGVSAGTRKMWLYARRMA